MTISYIALGSNLNNPCRQLQMAILHIRIIPKTVITAKSSVHETKPIGPQDQPNFMNQVIAIETKLTPHELLYALQAIENKMGRVRTVQWGPRIIDCDILLFGDEVISTDDLTIPHPEMHHRDFVLKPLSEIKETRPAGCVQRSRAKMTKKIALYPG
ncbi:MAG: 2-amino-4-hydroxy-6-hydroxymethyldihydropteridine diphosphokinase, partial [Gammaproteobacteria bacterium]|nr:2-amino-4-hydroxy-6-hydroxymethyldihydropteridine diphosphokinase [Gammaproteobacteria bacterium]